MAKLFALLDGLTERGLLTDIGGFVPGDWEREVTMFRDLAKDNKIDGDDLEAAKEDVYVRVQIFIHSLEIKLIVIDILIFFFTGQSGISSI